MGILANVTNFFKSAPKTDVKDRYGILQPLLSTEDRLNGVKQLLGILIEGGYGKKFTGRNSPNNPHVLKALAAYKDYVKGLSGQDQMQERAKPFSTMIAALNIMAMNLQTTQDNYQTVFGALSAPDSTDHIRASTLIILGYLEKVDQYTTWLSNFSDHITADEHDMIPPFRSHALTNEAAASAEFALLNLHKWNGPQTGILYEVKTLQRNGADVSVHTDGTWIDEVAHDQQYNPVEQELISASLRSTSMIGMTYGLVKIQERIDLYTVRKEWLTSKIVFEQSKLRGMDLASPDYVRLKKACDHYSDLISKYERRIERLRG